MKVFLEDLNKFHPNLKFTNDSSEERFGLLDLKVKQGKIEVNLHVRPKDRNQYIHYNFSHPEHTKQSIVFSQSWGLVGYVPKHRILESTLQKWGLGFINWVILKVWGEWPSGLRHCSKNRKVSGSNATRHSARFRVPTSLWGSWWPSGWKRKMQWLTSGDWSGKVKFSGYTRRNKREKKGVPFLITYHPSLKNIGRILNQNAYIPYVNEDVESVFALAPMISFLSARKTKELFSQGKTLPFRKNCWLSSV